MSVDCGFFNKNRGVFVCIPHHGETCPFVEEGKDKRGCPDYKESSE